MRRLEPPALEIADAAPDLAPHLYCRKTNTRQIVDVRVGCARGRYVMTEVDLALFGLRAWVGIVMLAHGIKHLRGREKTTNWLASIGYKNAPLQWFAMSATEVGVGVLLIVGLLTSLAAAGTAAIMVVAYLTVHRKAGFWATARPDEGWEFVATLLVAALAIGLLGPGGWSLDDAIGIATDLDGWVGLLIVIGGEFAGLGQVATFFRPESA